MSKKADKAADIADAVETLRKLLKPGQKVYTIIRHRAASGMSRVVDVFIVEPEYETTYPPLPADKAQYPGQTDKSAKPKRKLIRHGIRSIGHLMSRADIYSWDSDKSGLRVSGCGFDAGFDVVYNLGATIWPKGTPKPHGRRNGEPDRSGGYALKQSSL